jgi:hypothetical protein
LSLFQEGDVVPAFLLFESTHTPGALNKPTDTFQDSSQLLMRWPFREASQAIHRRDKFGTCNWHLVQPTNPIYPAVEFYWVHKYFNFLS